MAGLSIQYKAEEWKVFKKLMDVFPEFQARALGYVGEQTRITLKKRLLSGQELNVKGDAHQLDVLGRRLMSYTIGKNLKYVKVSSYPVNLFERGRGLRSGATEPGKKIISVKLKSIMASELQSVIDRFDKTILEPELKKFWN